MARLDLPLPLCLTGASGVVLLATAIVGLGGLGPELRTATATAAQREAGPAAVRPVQSRAIDPETGKPTRNRSRRPGGATVVPTPSVDPKTGRRSRSQPRRPDATAPRRTPRIVRAL